MNGQNSLIKIEPRNYFFSIAAVLGLMFAFVAPDDDLPNGWFSHVVLWQIQTLLPMFVAISANTKLENSAIFAGLSAWLKLSISGIFASVACSPIALLGDIALGGEKLVNTLPVELLDEFVSIAPPIVLFWVAINAPLQLGWELSRSNDEDELTSKLNPPFYSLLPQELQTDLLYIKSELHYLQVVTSSGKTLILYSLKNAVAELEGPEGIQVHRSFWVNLQQIDSFKRRGREGEIRMNNGDLISVSRSKVPELERALN